MCYLDLSSEEDDDNEDPDDDNEAEDGVGASFALEVRVPPVLFTVVLVSLVSLVPSWSESSRILGCNGASGACLVVGVPGGSGGVSERSMTRPLQAGLPLSLQYRAISPSSPTSIGSSATSGFRLALLVSIILRTCLDLFPLRGVLESCLECRFFAFDLVVIVNFLRSFLREIVLERYIFWILIGVIRSSNTPSLYFNKYLIINDLIAVLLCNSYYVRKQRPQASQVVKVP